MSQHQAGATVRIQHPRHRCRYDGMVGTVAEVRADQLHPYRIDGIAPWPLWFGDKELVPVHKPQEGA